MFEDKISIGGEITAQGEFAPSTKVCYLFLAPKSDAASSVAVLSVKLSYNDSLIDYPFTAGVWNPIVINKVNATSDNLSNYRIFWGFEK